MIADTEAFVNLFSAARSFGNMTRQEGDIWVESAVHIPKKSW